LNVDVLSAMAILSKTMEEDQSYAWAWASTVAVAVHDAGADYLVAVHGAAKFLRIAFGVDVSSHPAYVAVMGMHGQEIQ
jgi:hypothetical protein